MKTSTPDLPVAAPIAGPVRTTPMPVREAFGDEE